jgi:hypothetical protein
VPIPVFNEQGWLPEGIHQCTVEEAETRFGNFQTSDRRPQLWREFKQFHQEARATGLVLVILLDGSFVTAVPEPNDIDVILVVSAAHDFSADLTPSEYNVLSKRRVRKRHGIDVLVARADSEEYRRYVRLFQQVRLESERTKGIISLKL